MSAVFRRLRGVAKTEAGETTTKVSEQKTSSEPIRELCGPEEDLYRAMSYVLLLHPERLVEMRGLEGFIQQGEESEKKGDMLKARIAYENAGKLALYKGSKEQARRLFSKCMTLPDGSERKKIYATIVDKADRVFDVAQKYYATKPKLE